MKEREPHSHKTFSRTLLFSILQYHEPNKREKINIIALIIMFPAKLIQAIILSPRVPRISP